MRSAVTRAHGSWIADGFRRGDVLVGGAPVLYVTRVTHDRIYVTDNIVYGTLLALLSRLAAIVELYVRLLARSVLGL